MMKCSRLNTMETFKNGFSIERDGKVYTTEGNSGNKVSNKEYPIDTEYITAYGSWYK